MPHKEEPEQILPRVYRELRALAGAKMAVESKGHTLNPTALVHEAWLRLSRDKAIELSDRGAYFFAAAESMRRILVEHARKRGRVKRGGKRERLPLSLADLAVRDNPEEILAVDEAIDCLAKEDETTAAVVRLRFFAGLSVAETAQALRISERSLHREWTYARARLAQLLAEDGD